MVERRGFFDGGAKRVIPIEDRTGQYLKMKNKGSFKVKGKHKKRKFDIGKTVWLQQSDNSEKIILIEEILWYNGKREDSVTVQQMQRAAGGGEKKLWWLLYRILRS